MHIDFKITTWERLALHEDTPPEEIAKIIEGIESGEYTSGNDIYHNISDDNDIECYIVHDCSEQLSLEANNGNSTIEIFNDKSNEIWSNEKLPFEFPLEIYEEDYSVTTLIIAPLHRAT